MSTIVVKGLSKDLRKDNIYDFFRSVGEIKYCKLFRGDSKNCRSVCYITFKEKDSAEQAIQNYKGKKILGARFLCVELVKEPNYFGINTLLVTKLDDSIKEKHLRKQFISFGKVTSLVLLNDYKTSKIQCYVSFKSIKDATGAIIVMNEKEIGSKTISVKFADANEEDEQFRIAYLKRLFGRLIDKFNNKPINEKTSAEIGISNDIFSNNDENGNLVEIEPLGAGNVIVKNLDCCIDEKILKKDFSLFGDIKYTKILRDTEHNSKGIGFVCFKSIKDAVGAIISMNRRTFFSKSIYTEFAKSNDEECNKFRTAFLKNLLCKLLDETAIEEIEDNSSIIARETIEEQQNLMQQHKTEEPHILYYKVSDTKGEKNFQKLKNEMKTFSNNEKELILKTCQNKKGIEMGKNLHKLERKKRDFSKNVLKEYSLI